MAHVNCNLCGEDDFEVVFAKGHAQLHQIVRCRKCELMYANPQESVDCDRIVLEEKLPGPEDPGFPQYFRKQQVQLPDNRRALRVLNDFFPKRGKLLEVGSYMGFFANEIKCDGWEVTCLEPFKGAADYSREHFNLNVMVGLLPQSVIPTATFDAVMMLHVIEHMPDPAANVRELRRMLKPGGMMVVETPRFDSLMFKLLGRRERSLSNCNGHIFFFTVPTLTKLIEKEGFKVERVDLVGRTLTADRFLTNVGLVFRSQSLIRGMRLLSAKTGLEKVVFHVNVHDMQRLYCRAV